MTPRTLLRALLALALAQAPAAAGAPAATTTGDTLRLTIDDAVRRARESGVEARVAQAGIAVADGQVRQALAEALPQITGTVVYNRKFASVFQNLSGDSTFGPLFKNSSFAAIHGWTAEVTATQLLWSGGRVGAGLRAAGAVGRATRAERDETLADVTLRVRAAYLEALYALQVEAIAESSLSQSRAHLRQVRLFRRQGSRSEYELLQARVDAANQEPPVVAARNAAAEALLQLKRLMNVPLGEPVALTTPLAFADGRVPVLAGDAGDGAARRALAGATAIVDARREAARAEGAARWPRLLATGTLSHQAYPPDGWPNRRMFARAIDASVKLEWPIFQGFRTFGTVERANAELRQAQAQLEQARQGVAFDVEQARQEVDRTLATLAARRGTAQLAGRACHLASVRWQNGLSTQLEVSDARLQMESAQVNEVSAIKEYRLALLRLERATGRPLPLTNKSIDELALEMPSEGDR